MSGTVGGAGSPAAALGGLGGSLEDKDCELLCPVCFELIEEAYVTRCGHSFCFACVGKALDLHRRCPKCGASLPSREHIFPNFLLNELVAKRRLQLGTSPAVEGSLAGADTEGDKLRAALADSASSLRMRDVQALLQVLQRRARLLEAECAVGQQRLLYEFLQRLRRTRMQQVDALSRDLALVNKDMETVMASLKELGGDAEGFSLSQTDVEPEESVKDGGESFGFVSAPSALRARWGRLSQHFDDVVQCYFSHRSNELYFPGSGEVPARESSEDHVPQGDEQSGGDQRLPTGSPLPAAGSSSARSDEALSAPQSGLEAFKEDLVAFTRYRSVRPVATLSYCSDAINYSTIVSTIEFDKDEEFFAIAGVTKRIKVFELASVVRDAVDVHYPCAEMQCSHKISCVAWNHYHKHILASSDYEGSVCVWDAHTGQRTRALQEHDKRCWSVHFNSMDVRLLASGSDDCRVKLWALNHDRSVTTLEAKFNVCCVRFNPKSSCHLAFGSADHCVHYYDLRAPRHPLAVFKDHRKAVSYVKFLDASTLVSASTDSQLKLWRVDQPRCVRSFTGHANEKNFVGLATDGKYIACGSENNALYVYYEGLSKPLLNYRFDAVRGFLERERRDEEPSEFVSAVCWRRGDAHSTNHNQLLLAANSQGTIKVLELV